MPILYVDLVDLPENDRIDVIAAKVKEGLTIAVITDSDPGKMDRYVAKLQAKCPGLKVVWRGDGPVKNMVTIKVALEA